MSSLIALGRQPRLCGLKLSAGRVQRRRDLFRPRPLRPGRLVGFLEPAVEVVDELLLAVSPLVALGRQLRLCGLELSANLIHPRAVRLRRLVGFREPAAKVIDELLLGVSPLLALGRQLHLCGFELGAGCVQ